jgi:hypothetical protein
VAQPRSRHVQFRAQFPAATAKKLRAPAAVSRATISGPGLARGKGNASLLEKPELPKGGKRGSRPISRLPSMGQRPSEEVRRNVCPSYLYAPLSWRH